MMHLTFQTDSYDFYAQSPHERHFDHMGNGVGRLFNIIPTGGAKPTTGYYSPVYIKKIKKQNHLPTYQVFDKYFK
jgi:hypothetical protein|tara:strand:- start:318 stop:542 length:225 start_codon:yes stop_codon:yes gene_type:complete